MVENAREAKGIPKIRTVVMNPNTGLMAWGEDMKRDRTMDGVFAGWGTCGGCMQIVQAAEFASGECCKRNLRQRSNEEFHKETVKLVKRVRRPWWRFW